MNPTFWRGSADFYCGLLLLSISACSLWLISDLDVGSARDMGPAYFPLIIAVVLGGMGLIMMLRGVATRDAQAGHIELRPLFFVLASFLAFGLLITHAGLLVAIFAQVAIAHFASPETKPLESLLFALGLAAFSFIVFVHLLGIPVSMLP